MAVHYESAHNLNFSTLKLTWLETVSGSIKKTEHFWIFSFKGHKFSQIKWDGFDLF